MNWKSVLAAIILLPLVLIGLPFWIPIVVLLLPLLLASLFVFIWFVLLTIFFTVT